jgi:hypothetical protein
MKVPVLGCRDKPLHQTGFLRFAMTERLLISGRHQALCAVDATRRVLEGGHRVDSVAALLEKIIDEVADTMDRMAEMLMWRGVIWPCLPAPATGSTTAPATHCW